VSIHRPRAGSREVRSLVLTCLAASAGACGGGDQDGPPEPAPATTQIVFQSTRLTGTPDIFLMDPDGSNVRPVVTGPAVDQTPVLSGDGRTIAFVSDRDGINAVYLVNLDGTGLHRLMADTIAQSDPAWSPDGHRLAFIRSTSAFNGDRGLFVADADGSNLVRLYPEGAQPAWSPDGNRIAFSSGSAIWLIGPDGSDPVELTATAVPSASDPAWSPDGARIAYGGAINNQDIFVVNADGADQHYLVNTPEPEGEIQPVWSPDGAYIAFTGFRNGNQEIVRRKADGSSEVVLTNLGAKDFHPSWGPVP
jgi:TolB protein